MKTIITILITFLLTQSAFLQNAPYVDFNASPNSYIDYGKGLDLDCFNDLSKSNKLTITLWVKWTNKNALEVGKWANLFALSDSTGSGDNGVFWVQHNSDNSKFEFALHTTSREYLYSTTTPVNGTWYFLALVYDGSLPNNNMKIYVNGVLEASLNKTGKIRSFPALSRLNMGRWPNSGNNYRHFNGKIDEVSVWKVALTSTQIKKMMISSEFVTGEKYDETGLIGYWNFDDKTATDLCSCKNNGIVGGGATFPTNPIPTTKLRTDFCGATFSNISTIIYCEPVANVEDYEWKFVNASIDYNQTRSNIWPTSQKRNYIRISYMPNIVSGFIYYVRVRAKVAGQWGEYGEICQLTVGTTKLQNNYCGITTSNPQTIIYCDAVLGVQDYEWEFQNDEIGYYKILSEVWPINPNRNYIRISYMPSIQKGYTYNVRVRAKVNDIWGTWGDVCTITLLNSMKEISKDNSVVTTAFSYPNPFSETSNIIINGPLNQIFSITVCDITGKVVFIDNIITNQEYIIGQTLNTGVYFIVINGEDYKETLKIIKTK